MTQMMGKAMKVVGEVGTERSLMSPTMITKKTVRVKGSRVRDNTIRRTDWRNGQFTYYNEDQNLRNGNFRLKR